MVIPSSLVFDTYEHFSIPRSLLHQTRKNAQRNAKRLPDERVGWRWHGSTLLWERSMAVFFLISCKFWTGIVLFDTIYIYISLYILPFKQEWLAHVRDVTLTCSLAELKKSYFLWNCHPIPLGSKGSFFSIQNHTNRFDSSNVPNHANHRTMNHEPWWQHLQLPAPTRETFAPRKLGFGTRPLLQCADVCRCVGTWHCKITHEESLRQVTKLVDCFSDTLGSLISWTWWNEWAKIFGEKLAAVWHPFAKVGLTPNLHHPFFGKFNHQGAFTLTL